MVLHQAFLARHPRKTGIGEEVRHGVTSSCETSSNKHATPHLPGEYNAPAWLRRGGSGRCNMLRCHAALCYSRQDDAIALAQHQGRGTPNGRLVRVGPSLAEQLRHLQVPAASCRHQGRGALLLRLVRLERQSQQPLHLDTSPSPAARRRWPTASASSSAYSSLTSCSRRPGRVARTSWSCYY